MKKVFRSVIDYVKMVIDIVESVPALYLRYIKTSLFRGRRLPYKSTNVAAAKSFFKKSFADVVSYKRCLL